MIYKNTMPHTRAARAYGTGVIAALCLSVFGLLSTAAAQTLARIGSDEITAQEFRQMYERTHQAPPKLIFDAKNFLSRLVDYKVKLKHAVAENIPNEPAVAKEIADYRNDLAVSYLTEKRLVLPGARRYHDLRREELMLWHIFFRVVKREDESIDTVDAYHRGTKILEIVRKSTLPFDSLVMSYSDDDSKDRTRGQLGWWIAGSGYTDIDDEAYSLQEGEISKRLVRSPFGYHILKVSRRRPALVRVRGSHILYRLDVSNPSDTAAAYARLLLVLDSLKRGMATFEELARRNSQDPISGAEGGDLGWMDRGTLEDNFEYALFDLKPGEVSGIVRTQFGMHIIKKTADDKEPEFASVLPQLKQTYLKERFESEYRNWLRELIVKHKFEPRPKVEDLILSRLKKGTTTSTPDWWSPITFEDRKAYLFLIGGEPFTVGQAIERIKVDPALQMRRFTDSGMDSIVVVLAQREALVLETKGLEQEFPEFAQLIEEYRNGVYVTTLEQRAVNANVTVTDEEVRKYWEANEQEFRFPNRVDFSEILGYGEEFMQKLLDSVKAGASFDALQAAHSRRTGIGAKGGEWGLVPADRNDLAQRAWTGRAGDISDVFKSDKGYSIIRVNRKEPARIKTFEEAEQEARARLKAEKLEAARKQWIAGLRTRYNVEQFDSRLEALLSSGTK